MESNRPLRILHTSDWHLGASFHDQDRSADEAHVLAQLKRICEEERVDVVLIAGDVFDTANPGAGEVGRYYAFLAELVFGVGVASVVVIGGNHDSALRLEGPREILQSCRVHVVGQLPYEAPAESCIVELRGRDGGMAITCAAVPYLRDGDVRRPAAGELPKDAQERHRLAVQERYAQVYEVARRRDLPTIIMGHCYAKGAVRDGSERPVQLGNLGLVEAEVLGAQASYLALGHLHRPQAVGGREHWRYSGSLLPTGFDEVGTRREVVLADIAPAGGPAAVRRIALAPYRLYARLAGTPAELREQIAALEPPADGQPTPLCEARVKVDGPCAGLAIELGELAKGRGWSLVRAPREEVAASEGAAAENPRALDELQPEDVFCQLYRRQYGGAPDEEMLAEFRGLVQSVMDAG